MTQSLETLMEQAGVAGMGEDWESAEKLYSEALAIAREKKPDMMQRILNLRGVQHMMMGHRNPAWYDFEEATSYLNYKDQIAQAHINMADLLREFDNDIEEAHRQLDYALIFGKEGTYIGAIASDYRGLVHVQEGNYDKAIATHETAASLLEGYLEEMQTDEARSSLANCMHHIAEAHLLKGITTSAGDYAMSQAERAHDIFQELGDTYMMARTLMTIGEVYSHSNEYSASIAVFKRALRLTKHPRTKARIHFDLARPYLASGKLDDMTGQLKEFEGNIGHLTVSDKAYIMKEFEPMYKSYRHKVENGFMPIPVIEKIRRSLT
ncbi:MAG: tetratricopeptide repeat protein [Nanoarchaeota archaeon]|nr:tetratricopeptide repeat protein [Nanoarchaeota archaeon]